MIIILCTSIHCTIKQTNKETILFSYQKFHKLYLKRNSCILEINQPTKIYKRNRDKNNKCDQWKHIFHSFIFSIHLFSENL